MKQVFYVFLALFLAALASGCANEEALEAKQDFDIRHQGQNFKSGSAKDLASFAAHFLDGGQARVLDARFETLADDQGTFYAVVARYAQDGQDDPGELYIVLEQAAQKNGGGPSALISSCTMECKANFCNSCGMSIHERCARLTCACSRGENDLGGCDAKITFE